MKYQCQGQMVEFFDDWYNPCTTLYRAKYLMRYNQCAIPPISAFPSNQKNLCIGGTTLDCIIWSLVDTYQSATFGFGFDNIRV